MPDSINNQQQANIDNTISNINEAEAPGSVTNEMVAQVLEHLNTQNKNQAAELAGIKTAYNTITGVFAPPILKSEHVKIIVRGYDKTENVGVSGAGATVFLDIFNFVGYPAIAVPRQTLIADENGVVEFDVPYGVSYAVSARIDGLGMSFQYVELASRENMERILWSMTYGVYVLWSLQYSKSVDNEQFDRNLPLITDNTDDGDEFFIEAGWDVRNSDEEWVEDYNAIGVAVISNDTSFAITPNCRVKDVGPCLSLDTIFQIPTMQYWGSGHIIDDMDGYINTVKLTSSQHCNPEVRNVLRKSGDHWLEKRYDYIPSMGQLNLIKAQRGVINHLLELVYDYNKIEDVDFVKFPENTSDRSKYAILTSTQHMFPYFWGAFAFLDHYSNVLSSSNNIWKISSIQYEI